jgi:hypothetical protein
MAKASREWPNHQENGQSIKRMAKASREWPKHQRMANASENGQSIQQRVSMNLLYIEKLINQLGVYL